MGKRWTRAEEVALLEGVAEGATDGELAAELARTWKAVWAKRVELGVVRGRMGRPPDPFKRARLMALLAAGLTLTAAARLMGVTSQTAGETARCLAREGLLRRVGGGTSSCRYVPVDWNDEATVRLNAGRHSS